MTTLFVILKLLVFFFKVKHNLVKKMIDKLEEYIADRDTDVDESTR